MGPAGRKSYRQGQSASERVHDTFNPTFERNGVFNFLGLPRGKSQIISPMTLAKMSTELRNKIYTYLVPNENAVLSPSRHRRSPSLRSNSPYDSLQLAHVCQHIRLEFYPLYFQPHVQVRGRDFARFTLDFVAHGNIQQSDSTVFVLPPLSRHHGSMDILPFMRLLRNSILGNDCFELFWALKFPLAPRLPMQFHCYVKGPYQRVRMAVLDLFGLGLGPALGLEEGERWYDLIRRCWPSSCSMKMVLKSRLLSTKIIRHVGWISTGRSRGMMQWSTCCHNIGFEKVA